MYSAEKKAPQSLQMGSNLPKSLLTYLIWQMCKYCGQICVHRVVQVHQHSEGEIREDHREILRDR